MQALLEEDIQRKGMVIVLYLVDQQRFHSDRPFKFSRCLWLLPIRVTSVHVCYSGELMKFAANLLTRTMEGRYLCRFRNHAGMCYV